MLVVSADHAIDPLAAFVDSVGVADAAAGDNLVCFGVEPKSAHTGYGYLAVSPDGDAPAGALRS